MGFGEKMRGDGVGWRGFGERTSGGGGVDGVEFGGGKWGLFRGWWELTRPTKL